jgi:hypothetical protein
LTGDGRSRVALWGECVPYSDEFRQSISTNYPSPRYLPGSLLQVTLINFTTTGEGLTELLLNNLIEIELAELERKYLEILEANSENTRPLKETETEIC